MSIFNHTHRTFLFIGSTLLVIYLFVRSISHKRTLTAVSVFRYKNPGSVLHNNYNYIIYYIVRYRMYW